MMVGWGGNNGSTLSATILANRHNIIWRTKSGIQQPNYIGSVLRASTVRLGADPSTGKDVFVPVSDVLPMVHPNDLVLGGWDISGARLDEAMKRAQVLDWDLQRQVLPHMAALGAPLPSIYYPDFIAANQEARADNVVPGQDKNAHLEHLRADIRRFKAENALDRVIVFWTANTERYSEIIPGVNDTADALLAAIQASHSEVSPSTLFAVAAILEGEPFINGAPQNTFVPGVIELAERHKAFIGGDDLKSGQTKLKSVFAEFLVNAGIKPLSIASYNHLGNNDGHNLSAEPQFKSKEISKSSVVDDMVGANHLLFKRGDPAAEKGSKGAKGEHPDHIVVIKYVPAVGDSKRAIDEYYSEIFCGGRSTINIFNECEVRIQVYNISWVACSHRSRTPCSLRRSSLTWRSSRSSSLASSTATCPRARRSSPRCTLCSPCSRTCLRPRLSSLVRPYAYRLPCEGADLISSAGTDVVNSLNRQRNALETFMKACIGLEGSSDLLMETRIW